jgi:hypothetical protein
MVPTRRRGESARWSMPIFIVETCLLVRRLRPPTACESFNFIDSSISVRSSFCSSSSQSSANLAVQPLLTPLSSLSPSLVYQRLRLRPRPPASLDSLAAERVSHGPLSQSPPLSPLSPPSAPNPPPPPCPSVSDPPYSPPPPTTSTSCRFPSSTPLLTLLQLIPIVPISVDVLISLHRLIIYMRRLGIPVSTCFSPYDGVTSTLRESPQRRFRLDIRIAIVMPDIFGRDGIPCTRIRTKGCKRW